MEGIAAAEGRERARRRNCVSTGNIHSAALQSLSLSPYLWISYRKSGGIYSSFVFFPFYAVPVTASPPLTWTIPSLAAPSPPSISSHLAACVHEQLLAALSVLLASASAAAAAAAAAARKKKKPFPRRSKHSAGFSLTHSRDWRQGYTH